MKLLKGLLAGTFFLIAALVLVGFFLPSSFRVERAVVINAPAADVYPHIINLREWRKWGVWFQRDPDMQLTYTGPEAEIGMKSQWLSESEGSGEMQITAVEPLEKVTYSLYFPDFQMGSTGELTLIEENGETHVIWADYGDVGGNPVNHYFAAMMDSMVGPDFEAGLNNLKHLVEDQ